MNSMKLCRKVCEGCGLGIADRYVMRVADGSWHEDCLVCCICHAPLVHSCFTRSGRIYCRQDYDRYPNQLFFINPFCFCSKF